MGSVSGGPVSWVIRGMVGARCICKCKSVVEMVLVVEVGFRPQVRRSCFRSGGACLCQVRTLAEDRILGVDVACGVVGVL